MSDDGTLRSAAYAMSKAVVGASQRDEIRTAIEDLSRASPGENGSAGNLSYAARRQHAQFYGFLIVDEQRDAIEQLALDPLTEQQRRVISRGHASVRYLNQACVAPLLAIAPNIERAVDPYSRFRQLASPVQPAPTLLKDEIVTRVAASFSNTKAAEIIRDTPPEIREALGAEQCHALVIKLLEELERTGATSVSRDLMKAIDDSRGTSGRALLGRYSFAITSLHAMLRCLDQLVFQATLRPRITTLGAESVFSVRGPTGHAVGTSYTVDCQPTPDQIHIEPSDVVLLTVAGDGSEVKITSFVTHVGVNFSQETGMQMRLDLRELNEDLNPYYRLVA